MTATTRTTESTAAPATLYLAFELGSTKWTLGFTHVPAQRPRVRTIAAGDLRALEQEVLCAKARFGLALETPVRSCYEAGHAGKRARRIGIVALARKLMIALWRYVEHGVIPDGARLTPTIR